MFREGGIFAVVLVIAFASLSGPWLKDIKLADMSSTETVRMSITNNHTTELYEYARNLTHARLAEQQQQQRQRQRQRGRRLQQQQQQQEENMVLPKQIREEEEEEEEEGYDEEVDIDAATTILSRHTTQSTSHPGKVVGFVHFHKAGGTSMVQMFQSIFQPWSPSKNGNPWGRDDKDREHLIPFWRYNMSQMDQFLSRQPDVRFLSTEWNFFTSVDQTELQSTFELVTCMRDPYARFVSNLFFNHGGSKYRKQPMEWATQNLIWHRDHVPKKYWFPVNFNKPNYYVAFLNGLADKEYSWKDLNQTHLGIAKERLHWFSAILILEDPETHVLLQEWLPGVEQIVHENTGTNKKKNTGIGMSREEFNTLNELDVELYEYARNLTHARLAEQQERR